MAENIVEFMVFRLLENAFASQKKNRISSRFLSSPPRQKEITHTPRQSFFKNLSSQQKRRGRRLFTSLEIMRKPFQNPAQMMSLYNRFMRIFFILHESGPRISCYKFRKSLKELIENYPKLSEIQKSLAFTRNPNGCFHVECYFF